MISVICASNKQDILEKMLIPSLKMQINANWELIVIDAKKEGLNSASEALNMGANIAHGDILLFVHQDVEFLRDDVLERLERFCLDYDFGVGGVAGRALNETDVYTSVIHGADRKPAGIMIAEPRETDALDECMFFVKKDSFKRFDDLGKTWHFYAVEYSQRCKLSDEKVMLFPLEIYHLSPGWSLDNTYWKTLKSVAKKYKKELKYIVTTMGIFRNSASLPLHIAYRKLKMKLKG